MTKSELAERFGPKVAELVDGPSKLDKMEFRSREEAQAENFRKMLLAMARDVRVISSSSPTACTICARSARCRWKAPPRRAETLDIYAPIAHRLGLNNTYRELQDMSFANFNPHRYATLEKAVKAARNRREVISKISPRSARWPMRRSTPRSPAAKRPSTACTARCATSSCRSRRCSTCTVFASSSTARSTAIRASARCTRWPQARTRQVQGLHRDPEDQRLSVAAHHVGRPVRRADRISGAHAQDARDRRGGVAAHWLYKNGSADLSDVQKRAHQWLKSLLDIQSEAGDSSEFLEHVKIDLFPDAVYVFTPKSKIMALPRRDGTRFRVFDPQRSRQPVRGREDQQ